jgi:hypothetical protein
VRAQSFFLWFRIDVHACMGACACAPFIGALLCTLWRLAASSILSFVLCGCVLCCMGLHVLRVYGAHWLFPGDLFPRALVLALQPSLQAVLQPFGCIQRGLVFPGCVFDAKQLEAGCSPAGSESCTSQSSSSS